MSYSIMDLNQGVNTDAGCDTDTDKNTDERVTEIALQVPLLEIKALKEANIKQTLILRQTTNSGSN